MKELTVTEIAQVNGAGIIENISGGIGGGIGGGVYGIVGVFGGINLDLPLLGNININKLMPGLGHDVGGMIGRGVGGAVENVLTSIPLIGGTLGWLLGR